MNLDRIMYRGLIKYAKSHIEKLPDNLTETNQLRVSGNEKWLQISPHKKRGKN